MPFYDFHCPAGHVTEAMRPRDVTLIHCACGEPAQRASVYRVGFTGFARTPVDQREIKIGAYQEAAAEVEYRHSRETNVDGSPKPAPSLWRAAKAEANRLQKLGVKDSADLKG